MKITAAEIWVIEGIKRGFNPVVLRLSTDEGVQGIGELALAYGVGAYAGVGMLKQMAERFLLGADPSRIEAMWHTLFRRTFWGQGGGPVVYGAISAIDIALWDIKGKVLGLPVCEVLGGKTNDVIRVYANGWYGGLVEPAAYGEAAQKVVADGYDAMKFDPFATTRTGTWRAPERLLSKEMTDLSVARVAAVRKAIGPDVDILVEVHGNLGVTSAIEVGRRLEPLRPYFYEEPTDAMNVDAMRKVAENVNIPIAAGERLYTRYGFREYIEKQVLDILQPDIGLAGGITELKKIAAYAETYDQHIQPHRYAGPIITAAEVQLDACITNLAIQEWHPYEPSDVYAIVEDAFERHVESGRLTVPDTPGLGVTLNDEFVGRYPCTRIM